MTQKKTQTALISMMSESHIHVGVGQSIGALDLPVARERTTDYPFVPGSGVKGAVRVWAEETKDFEGDVTKLFGPKNQSATDDGAQAGAGHLLFGDARLLLLPVRSLSSAYKWVTCPLLLERLQRDGARSQNELADFKIPTPEKGKYLGEAVPNNILCLEEHDFTHGGEIDGGVINALASLLPDKAMADNINGRLVILHDDDFAWFAKFALPVMARNALDENKSASKNMLWYEESLPPDTLMYMVWGERQGGCLDQILKAVVNAPYIQMGGNETIGQGWFKLKTHPKQGDAA